MSGYTGTGQALAAKGSLEFGQLLFDVSFHLAPFFNPTV